MSEPGVHSTKPRHLRAIFSVALALFLLGFFGLILLQARQLVAMLKEEINLIVEIDDSANEEERRALKAYLESSDFIKPGTLHFISKEEGVQLLRDDFGESFLESGLPNPLYDVFTFNVKSDFMMPDSLAAIRALLKNGWKPVSDVFYQKSLVESLAHNLRRLTWLALGVSLLFVFLASALIHNTIRLSLYSNRFLIKTQELVGASWEFISKPYLRRSVWDGVLSGLLGIAMLNAMLWFAQGQIPELKALHQWAPILLLFGALLLAGVLITFLSTFYVVNKYLKMRVDDLY
jgi:cell division transport system permease protein